jgi:glycosyltransferase involved in cell wall biosynthesis
VTERIAGEPAVAVIIPTYNRAALLPATLESVFGQRDCPPFEVVVVDDASTDDTPAVVAGVAHPVTYVRQATNGGVARARATGVRRSHAPLLAFHDSDDLMLPGRLGALARYLDAHPDVAAVFSNGVVEVGGRETGRVIDGVRAAALDGRVLGIRDVLRDGLPMYLQTALIRRAAFERAGGIDETLDRHADLEASCRLVLTSRVVFLDHASFLYRVHDANQTRNRLRLREGLVEVMERLRRRHPESVEQCGAVWFHRREKRHLYRISAKHLQHGRLVRAVRAWVRALTLRAQHHPV